MGIRFERDIWLALHCMLIHGELLQNKSGGGLISVLADVAHCSDKQKKCV